MINIDDVLKYLKYLKELSRKIGTGLISLILRAKGEERSKS